MSFRDKLRADLKSNRYHLKDLAEAAMINPAYLSRILSAEIIPSTKTATFLAISATRLTGVEHTPDMFLTIAKELHND